MYSGAMMRCPACGTEMSLLYDSIYVCVLAHPDCTVYRLVGEHHEAGL